MIGKQGNGKTGTMLFDFAWMLSLEVKTHNITKSILDAMCTKQAAVDNS